MIHHPLSAPADTPGLDRVGRWRAALAAMREAGIHLVLSGHHHHGFSGALAFPASSPAIAAGSVLVVHAGTAVSTRTRGAEPNAYNLLQVDGGRRIEVAIHAWDGARFAAGPRRAFALAEGGWQALG